jgi:hypothetical protein
MYLPSDVEMWRVVGKFIATARRRLGRYGVTSVE